MPRVLWLDDELDSVGPAVEHLRAAGYEVVLVSTEGDVLTLLDGGIEPDVLVQDLHRPFSRDFETDWPSPEYDPNPGMNAAAGWRFYEAFLRRQLPHLPVVIYSLDAFQDRNRKRADDFNLTLLQKSGNPSELLNEVARAVSSQRIVLSGATIPSVVTVDFDRVNHALIQYLSKHPVALHEVSWASFEDLVARLLSELGYEVKRTKLTRDGGVDLWALHRHDLGETLYAIDAKKYSRDRLVGPEHVRAIRGVADLENATVGMIVTTSFFSPGARKLGDQYRYVLALKDFDAVTTWIRKVAARV